MDATGRAGDGRAGGVCGAGARAAVREGRPDPEGGDPAARFVAIAYGIIWLAILTYVLFVAGGLRRVNDEIADLKRRLRSKE
jgi:CcmD family protein